MCQEPGDDYILTNGELSHLAVPSFVVGSADTDHDSSLTDSVTMANGIDLNTPRYLWNHLDSPDDAALPAALAGDGMATDVNDISTDVEDSSEDEEGNYCSTACYQCLSSTKKIAIILQSAASVWIVQRI